MCWVDSGLGSVPTETDNHKLLEKIYGCKKNFKDVTVEDWSIISYYQILTESFIREFQDKVDWNNISLRQKMSEDFMREFSHKINWKNASLGLKLSENLIRDFQDKVDWKWISQCQKNLSESFIREFQDKFDWMWIMTYETLSEDFIREFQGKIQMIMKSFSHQSNCSCQCCKNMSQFPKIFESV